MLPSANDRNGCPLLSITDPPASFPNNHFTAISTTQPGQPPFWMTSVDRIRAIHTPDELPGLVDAIHNSSAALRWNRPGNSGAQASGRAGLSQYVSIAYRLARQAAGPLRRTFLPNAPAVMTGTP